MKRNIENPEWQRYFFENTEKALYNGVGKYGIPQIYPVTYEGQADFLRFDYLLREKHRETKTIHFFQHDYIFARLWYHPRKYMAALKECEYVMTPDFSIYTDFPMSLNIYNHYRKHWLGAYMQENGIRVIPTISWATPESYDWCFDGEPEGGTVAVSSVGCMDSKEKKELFISGYLEMVNRLHPESILFHGTVPKECNGNIVRIKTLREEFREAMCDGR